MPHATHTITVGTGANVNVVRIEARLGQESLLTLETIGGDNDVFTVTLVTSEGTTTIPYTVDIVAEPTLEDQATALAAVIDADPSTESYDSTASGTVVTITGTRVFSPSFSSATSGGSTGATTGTYNIATILGDETNTSTSLHQISLLTLTTAGTTGETFTVTLNGTGIQYTLQASPEDTTIEEQATSLAAAITSFDTNYTASSDGAVVTITGTTTGPITFTTAFDSSGSTTGDYTDGATTGVTLVPATTTDGQDSARIKDSFAIDFKGNETPVSREFEFSGSGLDAAGAAAEIAAFSTTDSELLNNTTGVLMEVVTDATTFPPAPNQVTLAPLSARVKYTYRASGVATNTLSGAASVDNTLSNTNGTFAVGDVSTVNEGAVENTTGVLDTWTVVVNGTTYTSTFTNTDKPLGGLTADEQAAEIARYLNDPATHTS